MRAIQGLVVTAILIVGAMGLQGCGPVVDPNMFAKATADPFGAAAPSDMVTDVPSGPPTTTSSDPGTTDPTGPTPPVVIVPPTFDPSGTFEAELVNFTTLTQKTGEVVNAVYNLRWDDSPLAEARVRYRRNGVNMLQRELQKQFFAVTSTPRERSYSPELNYGLQEYRNMLERISDFRNSTATYLRRTYRNRANVRAQKLLGLRSKAAQQLKIPSFIVGKLKEKGIELFNHEPVETTPVPNVNVLGTIIAGAQAAVKLLDGPVELGDPEKAQPFLQATGEFLVYTLFAEDLVELLDDQVSDTDRQAVRELGSQVDKRVADALGFEGQLDADLQLESDRIYPSTWYYYSAYQPEGGSGGVGKFTVLRP